MSARRPYIPALAHDRLTPLYDPVLRWVMREARFKRRLIEQARIEVGDRVLDVGCGTATLTLLARQAHPASDIVGLDGDAKVLRIGRAKAAQAAASIPLTQGLAFQLPYADGSFGRALSSLVLHHLTGEDKRRALAEVFRVLRPGGELHLVDFGKPHNAYTRAVSLMMRHLERASDNIAGRLPELFRAAGFDRVEETTRFTTVFGSLAMVRGEKHR